MEKYGESRGVILTRYRKFLDRKRIRKKLKGSDYIFEIYNISTHSDFFIIFFFSDDSERGSMMNLTVALRRQQLGRGRLKWSNFPQNFFLSYLTKHGSDFENNREFHECIENILEILRLVDRDANSNTSKWFKS